MQQEPINLEQTIDNELTSIGKGERTKLLPKNDFQKNANEYSATNKDALADGDEYGKGTGVFLDVFNKIAGGTTDNLERKNNIKINEYNSDKSYPDF